MRRAILLVSIVVLAVLPILPFVPKFWITLLNNIGIATIVVLGIVVLTGCAAITSFAQAAFVGIGAYTAALLSISGVSPWFSLIPSILLAGLSAYLIGIVTLRLSGHYLAIATIAWSITLFYAFGVSDFLGRFDGITGISVVHFFGIPLRDPGSFYYVIWAAVVLSYWMTSNLLRSRVGRAIRSLRGGRVAAEANGIDTAAARRLAFVYAACLAGLAGWLLAHLQRAINPSPFGLNVSIEYVLMAVVGGVSNIGGALLGATVVTLAQDQLQNILPRLLNTTGNFETVAFGIALVALLQFAPQGLWPYFTRLLPRPDGRGTDVRQPTEPLPLPARSRQTDPLLIVEGLQKSFGGLRAVKDFSFELPAGAIVALIGPNGAGKSTTFNLLTGVIAADSGRVTFASQDISRWLSRQVAKLGIARTFQHVKLVPGMSVIENVALGTYLRTHAGAVRGALGLGKDEESSAFAEAGRMLDRVGLGAVVHDRATSLALGQQRVVEIARALCLAPSLLLLDEPAAGLRSGEKAQLAELLRSLRSEGITILIVEHDMDFVMNLVDHVLVMNFGAKLAEGHPQVVRSDPQVIQAYLGGSV